MTERLTRMQAIHGKRNFNFFPETFTLPKEIDKLKLEMEKDKTQWWIIKPAASA